MLMLDSTIKTRLSTSGKKLVEATPAVIAIDAGFAVRHFNDLQDAVAEVSYYNSRHDIFLRGQRADHLDAKGHSALEAKLFRTRTQNPAKEVIDRIAILENFSVALRDLVRMKEGFKGVQTTELARWALLQHYEVCATPLLDMTRSVRVAASFATWCTSDPTSAPERDRYVYVLGMPHPTGSITVAYGDGIVFMNLRNLMPPSARRPHWQEGYLASTYPNSTHWDKFYKDKKSGLDIPRRNNFARRLIAKFRIPADAVGSFWDSANPRIPDTLLMPPTDPVRAFLTDSFQPAP